MRIQIQGHEARQGKTAFAFFVLRFARPVDRDAVIAALHADARFSALFTEWRNKRADLN